MQIQHWSSTSPLNGLWKMTEIDISRKSPSFNQGKCCVQSGFQHFPFISSAISMQLKSFSLRQSEGRGKERKIKPFIEIFLSIMLPSYPIFYYSVRIDTECFETPFQNYSIRFFFCIQNKVGHKARLLHFRISQASGSEQKPHSKGTGKRITDLHLPNRLSSLVSSTTKINSCR